MSDSDKSPQTRGAAPLIQRVVSSVPFRALRTAVSRAGDDGTRIHISGLRGSSGVFVAEALRAALERPVILVCPDEEAAEDAYSDLRTISSGKPALFPERDVFPHRYEQKENLTVRGDRNECLLKITNGTTDIVATSLLGMLEKTVPSESLDAHRIVVAIGDTVELEGLAAQLVALGYDHVPVVEEPGQFAVRGSIVDIFDPSWDFPARVELFDETVESIRTFDLDTQRSIEAIQSVTILPAASVPFEPEAVNRLRSYLTERDFDPDMVARIANEIEQTRSSYLWRRYAPALGVTGALTDYFSRAPIVVVSDVTACNRVYKKLGEEIERVAQRAEDDYPLLGLTDYLNPPDYFLNAAAATIWRWELAEVAGEDDTPFSRPREDERTVRFTTSAHPAVAARLDPLIGNIRTLTGKRNHDVYIYSESATQRDRLADMLEEDETLVHLPVGWITSGFVWADAQIGILTNHEIFGRVLSRPRKRQAKRRVQGMRHEHLSPGDYIVHIDYGIGRYTGLEKLQSGERGTECLVIKFDGDDKIFVPLEQMQLVEKYVGKEGVVPSLDKLGGTRWEKTKERAKRDIEAIAKDLLAVHAQREITPGHAFGPDTPMQRQLEAAFPYEETPHQLRAADEVKHDMEQPVPMDRLICGDVGFGKTEVAIRAAFRAINDSKQVAVLVPTTLLAFQHFRTFTERLQGFPVRVAMLSRFVSAAEQKKVILGVAQGTIDVVVGTHRLLSKDVKFNRLGLLVVDEEHRFGVKHKERLKQITHSVDVLAMTATPIPRTLYMSLSGLRKISLIDTPPKGRHPVVTEVTGFDEETIARAITEEVSRGGQVFFVHNRVRSIHSIQAFLERLLPGVKFIVAHGQMTEDTLEKAMLDFVEKKYDVLISTMIIESGLDFPNVNTIIVNRADRFGLAQLYQLRGRVGRREQQAYAYFMVPRQMSLTENAVKRLQAMEEFEELGSGYRLAMRDLEIRGAGNVLGVEQHGHVTAIGFEMYCRMLKEAVDTMRDGQPVELPQCKVESPYECLIPVQYIADPDERMMVYKRIAGMTEPENVSALADELVDRFGRLPTPAHHLIELSEVKLLAARLGVSVVQIREPGYRSKRPDALQQAAEMPHRLSSAPTGVRRSHTGSRRLARLAEMMDRGDLDRGPGKTGGVTLTFAPGRSLSVDQCGKLVETFGARLLFKSGSPFAVTLSADADSGVLGDTRNLLQVAYFSNRIGTSTGR